VEKTYWLRVAHSTGSSFKMLSFGMILLMDSSNNSKLDGLKNLLKKPAFMVGGAVVVLLLIFFTLFGGGGGQDPTAKGLRNLSNQHEATLNLIDSYSKDVRSDSLKSTLSQVSIILTADKNEIDLYYTEAYRLLKDVRPTVSAKPDKDLIKALDDAAILNNLDSALKTAVLSELRSLQGSIQELRRQNAEKKDLVALMQKVNLNTQTVLVRLEEVR
jgi:hypothetical protein